MDINIRKFLECLKYNGWDIEYNSVSFSKLPDHITRRYKQIPEEYISFVKSIGNIISPDERTWFLSIDDFNGNSD